MLSSHPLSAELTSTGYEMKYQTRGKAKFDWLGPEKKNDKATFPGVGQLVTGGEIPSILLKHNKIKQEATK